MSSKETNTKNMPFQLALDAMHNAKYQLDHLDPTLHLEEIAPCSIEDLWRLQDGVRAALAQLRDMESLYTGDADLEVSVSDIKDDDKPERYMIHHMSHLLNFIVNVVTTFFYSSLREG